MRPTFRIRHHISGNWTCCCVGKGRYAPSCQMCHSLPCSVLGDGEDNSMSWPQMRIQHLACQPCSSYKRRARAHAWHKASCTVAAATWSQSCWRTHKHMSSPFSSGHLSAAQPQFRQQQRPLQPCQMLFACQHVAGEPHGPLPRLRGSCTQSTLFSLSRDPVWGPQRSWQTWSMATSAKAYSL